ncbi:phosphotransferase family protein [Saccharopolyspora sp. TS4A08]|uniref:Phosphotransferase family protein n=1 Tax=Saccharopolyspora ipomoeae TaxID=3042027 RepID=A0ABT6PR74_9PSEU|nr:phosphotransferase family protein [Saccharopolyspora sp. TS4A08]MDI2030514.1 phosphotransferase family protein [Saccharopolyspora sp. TS4A08]
MTKPTVVDADPELGARVRAELGGSGPLRTLEGGRSGLTYAVTDSAGKDHVIKAVPPGRRAVGRNDVLRQSHVLSALADAGAGPGVPLPAVTARSEAEPAWFAMERAAGTAGEPVLEEHSLSPGIARDRMFAAARILRELHAVPLAEIEAGLRSAGGEVPEPLRPADELVRWTRTMQAVPEELRSGSAALLSALEIAVPDAVGPVLVHGDFRLGNLLCAGAEPTALVDWEIWSIGDPRVDLGWFGVFTDGALFPGVGRVVAELPSEAELLAAYGNPEPPDYAWFRALGRMKMAAIMGHNLKRHREGVHHDPVQEQLPATIGALIASGRSILEEVAR